MNNMLEDNEERDERVVQKMPSIDCVSKRHIVAHSSFEKGAGFYSYHTTPLYTDAQLETMDGRSDNASLADSRRMLAQVGSPL